MEYAGVSYSTYCHCGTSYGKYGAVPESDCNEPCSGDEYQTCGGYLANAVFHTESGTLNSPTVVVIYLYFL